MAQKTLAMRLLEGKKVPYEAVTYPNTERDATVVARHLGVPAAQVFKTLVVTRERGKPILVMIPADRQLICRWRKSRARRSRRWRRTSGEADAAPGQHLPALLNKAR